MLLSVFIEIDVSGLREFVEIDKLTDGGFCCEIVIEALIEREKDKVDDEIFEKKVEFNREVVLTELFVEIVANDWGVNNNDCEVEFTLENVVTGSFENVLELLRGTVIELLKVVKFEAVVSAGLIIVVLFVVKREDVFELEKNCDDTFDVLIDVVFLKMLTEDELELLLETVTEILRNRELDAVVTKGLMLVVLYVVKRGDVFELLKDFEETFDVFIEVVFLKLLVEGELE